MMFENVEISGKKQDKTSISFTIDDLVLLIGKKVGKINAEYLEN